MSPRHVAGSCRWARDPNSGPGREYTNSGPGREYTNSGPGREYTNSGPSREYTNSGSGPVLRSGYIHFNCRILPVAVRHSLGNLLPICGYKNKGMLQ